MSSNIVVFIIIVDIIIIASLAEYFNKKSNKAINKAISEYNEKLKTTVLKYEKQFELISKNEIEKAKKEYINKIEELKSLAKDETIQFPILAEAYADYMFLLDMEISKALTRKYHPAYKAAEKVAEISKEKRLIEKQFRMLKYQLKIYENVAPWLEDFKEVYLSDLKELNNDQTSDSDYDVVKKWLSPEEYNKLPNDEKYQLALNRYRNSPKKSNWQIGIEFERYIGYLFEEEGFVVDYFGAKEGLSDLGRDIIARKTNQTLIIQCKYWRKEKTIHEKHIFQLYGTLFAEQLEKNNENIKGIFITTTSLSDVARKYATKLNIEVEENFVFDRDYPCIKCNVSKRSGEKIYHLPFDQQYDKIVVEPSKGECFVATVKEAEKKGFRRALKWVPETN